MIPEKWPTQLRGVFWARPKVPHAVLSSMPSALALITRKTRLMGNRSLPRKVLTVWEKYRPQLLQR